MNSAHRNPAVEIFKDWSLYDRVIQFNYMKHHEMAQAISKSVTYLKEPCRVLDLGCGDGKLAQLGLRNASCERYHGIDLSAPALVSAKANLESIAEEIQFTEADLVRASGTIAKQWLNGESQAANLILASYSLHHLTEEETYNTLRTLRDAMDGAGYVCWIDLCTGDHESRQEYLNRFFQDELACWPALTDLEIPQVQQHMESSDFPLSAMRKIEIANKAGFRLNEILYHDSCYAAHLFQLV